MTYALPALPVTTAEPVEHLDHGFTPRMVHRIDVQGAGASVLVEAKIGAHSFKTVATLASTDDPVMYCMLGVSGWRFTATGANATVDIVSV